MDACKSRRGRQYWKSRRYLGKEQTSDLLLSRRGQGLTEFVNKLRPWIRPGSESTRNFHETVKGNPTLFHSAPRPRSLDWWATLRDFLSKRTYSQPLRSKGGRGEVPVCELYGSARSVLTSQNPHGFPPTTSQVSYLDHPSGNSTDTSRRAWLRIKGCTRHIILEMPQGN